MVGRVRRRSSVWWFGAVVLVLAVLACTGRGGRQAVSPDASSSGSHPVTAGRLVLGVEYAPTQLAAALRGSGASLAKPYPDQGQWKSVQSGPKARLDWRQVDAFVRSFQQAGFGELNLMMSARSDWANVDPPNPPFHRGRSAVKPEYEDDFATYVQSYVERYDGDGVDDLPGLSRPVLLYGFEAEFSTYVAGDAHEYLHLLELAYPAVKRANPNAKLMAAGLLMAFVFDGYPTDGEVADSLAHPDSRVFDKSPADIGLLLDRPDLFDVVDFHSLVDYTEIIPTVRWLRGQMARRGYDKPIWIGDTWGAVTLNAYGLAACPRNAATGMLGYPATEADRCRVAAALTALAGKAEPAHRRAIDWVRAEQAAGVIRKVVIAAGEGLAGINMGNAEDWEPLMFTAGGAGTSPWLGMIDRSWPARTFQGYRPSFYALKQVGAVIASYTNVRKVELSNPHYYAYEFTMPTGGPVIVAWADNGLWLPGDAPPVRQVGVPVGWTGPVEAQWTITAGDSPVRETLQSQNGKLTLALGPIPVFLSQAG